MPSETPTQGLVIKNQNPISGTTEIDATGATGIGIGAVVFLYLAWKFFTRKKKAPINASGSKPATNDDIKQLSREMKDIASSLGNGIDENRREIQKVGKCVERLDERTKGLEDDVRETREDVKKLQADHAFLSGRMAAKHNGKNHEKTG